MHGKSALIEVIFVSIFFQSVVFLHLPTFIDFPYFLFLMFFFWERFFPGKINILSLPGDYDIVVYTCTYPSIVSRGEKSHLSQNKCFGLSSKSSINLSGQLVTFWKISSIIEVRQVPNNLSVIDKTAYKNILTCQRKALLDAFYLSVLHITVTIYSL